MAPTWHSRNSARNLRGSLPTDADSPALQLLEGEIGPKEAAAGQALLHFHEEATPRVAEDPRLNVILMNLADVHGSLEPLQQRDQLLDIALGLLEQESGVHRGQVAGALVDLAIKEESLGNPQRESKLLQLALRLLEREHGRSHPLVADVLVGLGLARARLGDTWQEIRFLEQALRLEEGLYGSDSENATLTQARLAVAYGDFWSKERELELLEDALHLVEQEHGLQHAEVAAALMLLGHAHGDVGHSRRQQEFLQRALLVTESVLGIHHPSVAVVLANLGRLHARLGEVEKQKELLERASDIECIHGGKDHFKVALREADLGMACMRLGDPQRALHLFQHALRVREREHGPSHPQVAEMLVGLSAAHGSLGDQARQAELLQQALRSLARARSALTYERRPVALRQARKALSCVGMGLGQVLACLEERPSVLASAAPDKIEMPLGLLTSRTSGDSSARSEVWTARSLPEEGLALRPMPNSRNVPATMQEVPEEQEHDGADEDLATLSLSADEESWLDRSLDVGEESSRQSSREGSSPKQREPHAAGDGLLPSHRSLPGREAPQASAYTRKLAPLSDEIAPKPDQASMRLRTGAFSRGSGSGSSSTNFPPAGRSPAHPWSSRDK